jgi:ABC-2 type transport system ATP-binding protein
MSSYPAIVVTGLKKSFAKPPKLFKPRPAPEQALRGVSLQVARGETYGLLGPNGSGKSTLIRVLSTLLIPDEGDVRVMGHRLPDEGDQVRQKIGRVSADAAFYKKLSARENLLYSGLAYGLSRELAEQRALEALDRLGLERRRFKDPLEEMSRGMQQKISIARALLSHPPLVLLDEPTTGLDPKSKRDVLVFLEDLRRERGTTIFLTTHDMAEAERLCGRMSFLFHGRLVAEGTAASLKLQAGVSTLEDAFLAFAGERIDDQADAAAG